MEQKSCDSSCREGLVWFTGGSRTVERTGAGVSGQSLGRRRSIYLGKHAAVFQAEVYVILACVYEIQTEHIKKDKILGRQPAYGNVVWS
jgi:hypothetical protein